MIERALPRRVDAIGAAQRLRRRLSFSRLRSVAEVWIPYYVFDVQVTRHGERLPQQYAIDAVSGTLDLLQVEAADSELASVFPRTRSIPPRLGADEAAVFAGERVRRLLYTRGFFRLREPEIRASPADLTIYVPYWVGFYGGGERVQIRVIDGMAGRQEGAKVRELIVGWLAAS